MALRNIVKKGDDVLTKMCRPVEKFDEKLCTLLDDMYETMEDANGVGLAAPQVGLLRRIVVIDVGEGRIELINPEIIKKSSPYETEEGCLSLTGTRKTKRWQTIKVQWQNEKFQPRIKTFSGWTAEIIQHELDHCDGIII